MNVDDFLEYVNFGDIPPEPPEVSDWMYHEHRSTCTDLGMWAIVDMRWTKQLADWINGRTVLEIMAGCGWLAKALTLHGVNITATDDLSWSERHGGDTLVHPVIQAEASEAIEKYPADVLIVSWPPYGGTAILQAMKAWGSDRPVVYIGESNGGCNAPAEFFIGLHPIEDQPPFHLAQWPGIHDYVEIGYWHGDWTMTVEDFLWSGLSDGNYLIQHPDGWDWPGVWDGEDMIDPDTGEVIFNKYDGPAERNDWLVKPEESE
jgi:hypothetical protein